MKFELIVFSSEVFVENEVALVLDMFDKGLTRFHIRKPYAKVNELKNYLSSFPKKYRQNIYLHYDRNLAQEFNCKLHLQYKFAVIQGEIQQCNSVSVHSLKEFEYINGHVDSCTLSPIFKSISKENYAANEALNNIPKIRKTKIFALGGIDEKTIISAKERGFDGAASLGAIWHRKSNPFENYNTINKTLLNHKATC